MTARLTLHDYQQVARDHLRANPRACLFLDMGLGKTATTLSALTDEHLPALVVAPKRVAENVWRVEAGLWRPDLAVNTVAGSKATRERLLGQKQRPITVISRDNLKDVLGSGLQFKTLVIDELSGFKSRSSLRWRTARKVIRAFDMKHVWGLTGTPSPNGLLDLWGQMALIDGGERLEKTLTAYRSRYFRPGRQLPNGVIVDWPIREGMAEKIHDRLSDICLSMESEGRIELPPVTFNPVEVPLTPQARKIYRTLKRDLVVDLDMIGGSVHTAETAAALSNRLSQLSAGFIYHDPDDPSHDDGSYDVVHHEKFKAVEEIIEGTGSPVLVFYRYRVELEMLKARLGDLAHTMDEPDVIDRWNAGAVPVLLAHPASAGHGLNLQHGGHTIVWTSLPWSLEEWEQANKRLARQGQKHPVVIHLLLGKGTLDTAIKEALDGKADVQSALLRHLESPL